MSSEAHISYRQKQRQTQFVKYCELLNFLNGKQQNLTKLKSVASKINVFTPNVGYNSLALKRSKLFNFIRQRFRSQAFIKRKIRRSRHIRRKTFGYLSLQKTVHNLFISIHTRKGLLLYSSSICALGSKAKRERFGLMSLRQAGEKLATKLHTFGLHRINIRMRCFLNKGLRNLVWSLGYNKVRIYQIFNFIKIPHGSMTLPAKRRMKRRKI